MRSAPRSRDVAAGPVTARYDRVILVVINSAERRRNGGDDGRPTKKRGTTMTTARALVRTGTLAAVAASALLGSALPASAAPAAKVTICHATGSATNPYVVITPSAAGVYHGHYSQHDDLGQGDIIPKFTYDGVTYGPANGGKLAIANDCQAPVYEGS
jgi:hypothetical protein